MDNSAKVKNRKNHPESVKDCQIKAYDQAINKEKYLIEKLKYTLNSVSIEEENILSTQFQKLKPFKTFEKLLKQLNEKNKKRSKLQIISQNWDICLLCLINLGLIIYLIFFIFFH